VSLPQITRFRNRLNHTPLCLLRRHLPRKGGDRVLRKRRLRVDRTRLTPQRFQLYSQNTRQSPAPKPRAIIVSAPVTGWIGNVSVQAGGRPPGACRNVRRDDGGGGAPAGSAGSRISLNGRPSRDVLTGGSAKPATGEILAPCARPAPAGSQGEGGNGPVAGRLADAGGYLAQCQTPWRSRIIYARPSPCRTMPPAADRCPCPGGRTRHATACRMWTSSGEIRARAQSAPPRMPPRKRGMHTKPTSERHSLRAALRTVLSKTPASRRAEGFRASLQGGTGSPVPALQPELMTVPAAGPFAAFAACLLPLPPAPRLWHQCCNRNSLPETRYEPRRHHRPDPPLS
jgi:hypothetical protein